MNIAIVSLIIYIVYQILQWGYYRQVIRKIPVRIHVNGTRGKSDVTRLIAAGLRGGGWRVWAKTTGTLPRIVDSSGQEVPIIRRVPVNIHEQMRIVRKAANAQVQALVIECMAVNPELQWISDKKMIQGQFNVITNARLDHLDVMGKTRKEVAETLSLTIPYQGKIFTADREHAPVFAEVAARRGSECILVEATGVQESELAGFPGKVFAENVALALAVCTACGVERAAALKGMSGYIPDLGAFRIFKLRQGETVLYFANAFAANDPDSTRLLLLEAIAEVQPTRVIGIYNHRADRDFRLPLFQQMVQQERFTEMVWVGEIGQGHKGQFLVPGHVFTRTEEVVEYLKGQPDGTLVFGFGNLKGMGIELLEWIVQEVGQAC